MKGKLVKALILVAVLYMQSTPTVFAVECVDDLNCDEGVDLFDLIILRDEYGTTGSDAYVPAPVPKTGQTESYGTGDDGDLEKGVPWPDQRFTDNEDGTITDNLTGLIWLKDANCFGARTWSNALSDSNGLANGEDCGSGGSFILSDGSSAGDWRLPNTFELESLLDRSNFIPALPDDHPSKNTVYTAEKPSYYCYWSASTYAANNNLKWCVEMYSGYVGVWDILQKAGTPPPNNQTHTLSNPEPSLEDGVYTLLYVWPVRDGQCGSFGDSDGDGICDDGDGNGTPGDSPCIGGATEDCDDNCSFVDNPNQEDGDADGLGDVCDNCPVDYNPYQENNDTDGLGDVCDNCFEISNPDQEDNDIDGMGNVCDPDDDNDTMCDAGESDPSCTGSDNCPYISNPGQENDDADEHGNACDNCPYISNPGQENDDTDELGNVCDNCPKHYNPDQEDILPEGGNGWPDACECEGDLSGDSQVTASDIILYRRNYNRSYYLNEPCAVCIGGSNEGGKCLSDAECPDGDCGQNPTNPCRADLNCDMKVSGADTILLKADYNRTPYLNEPCPPPSWSGYPCTYPE